MGNEFSLAHLTVMDCTPPELVHIAARTGYDFVGIRLIPMGVPGEHPYLPEDKEMIRETKAALDETGIRVLDLELRRSSLVGTRKRMYRPWKRRRSWGRVMSFPAPERRIAPTGTSLSNATGKSAISLGRSA